VGGLGSDADDGFHDFVVARRSSLTRVAFLLTGDQAAAEDLVQEALIEAARRWRRLSAGGDPEPYVRRVLYTKHVDRWRRVGRREIHRFAEPPERAGGDESVAVDNRVVLREALARLTPRQRAVLVLRFYEDRTERQTAEVLSCSVSTVKSQTRLALRRLREFAPDLVAGFVDDDAHEAPVEVTR
jgi:RNA polymerase sigma-70 factor (sigma-E family)